MIAGKNITQKPLYGERLTGIPLRDLRLPELAQLYAHLVQKHGEDNSNCYEVLDHLKKWEDSKCDESIEKAYDEGYDEGYQSAMYESGMDEMDTYDDGFDAGYEEGYESAKNEFGASE